jgi:hypothetical protein
MSKLEHLLPIPLPPPALAFTRERKLEGLLKLLYPESFENFLGLIEGAGMFQVVPVMKGTYPPLMFLLVAVSFGLLTGTSWCTKVELRVQGGCICKSKNELLAE